MRRIPFFLLALLLALPVWAQQQYGSIAGTVVDNQKQPLPGVTVTLSGPAMQGTRVAVTDAQGRFRFVPVPPGKDYTLKFELSGFNTLEQTGIIVNLGKETSIAAEMSLSQFAEAITVTAEKIVVDTSKSTVDTNVEWGLIDSLANNRTFQSVMELAPGVQLNANNPRVHGAGSTDNLYLIDGVDTTDPRTQTWGTAINYDTIAEVQVQTAGYAAEYGRVTGGVVNLVTKSGGNEFHGILRYVQTDKDWAAGFKKGRTATILSDEKRPAASLGGPIARDKLWFFVAYESRNRDQQFPRATDSSNTTTYQDTSNYKGHYFSGKVTWQLNASNTISGWYNEDPIDISNAWGRYYLGTGVDPRSEATQQQGGNAWTLSWTGVLKANAFLEAKFGSYNGRINVVPQGPLGPEPTFLDVATNYFSGTTLELYKSDRTRDDLTLAASYFLDTDAGTHQLKAGVEYLKVKNSVLDVYYPSGGPLGPGEFVILVGGEKDSKFVNYNRPGRLDSENPYYALYVQDSWKVGKLTVNVGVRAEQIKLKNDAGREVVSFSFGEQLAPRLGFAYDLNGNSLHGSLARFYDIVTDYITAGLQPSEERQSVYVWGPAYDLGDDWVLVDDYPIKANNTVDPKLKPTYSDEATLGYDHALSNSMALQVNYVWRQQKRAIEDLDLDDNGSFYYTNIPGTWKKYQALELALRKRMAADRLQFITSYTYTLKDEGFATGSQFSGYGDSSVAVQNRWGRNDTKHLFKFDGSYTLPFNLLAGLSAYYYSGPVYSVYDRPRIAKGRGTRYLEPAGSRKVGAQWTVDLHLEQLFNIWKGAKGSIYADVFNVTNNQEPIARQGLKTARNFGKPTYWQTPRTYQIGVKLEF